MGYKIGPPPEEMTYFLTIITDKEEVGIKSIEEYSFPELQEWLETVKLPQITKLKDAYTTALHYISQPQEKQIVYLKKTIDDLQNLREQIQKAIDDFPKMDWSGFTHIHIKVPGYEEILIVRIK